MSPKSANQSDGQVVISICIGDYKYKGNKRAIHFFSAISYDYDKSYPFDISSFKILERRGTLFKILFTYSILFHINSIWQIVQIYVTNDGTINVNCQRK